MAVSANPKHLFISFSSNHRHPIQTLAASFAASDHGRQDAQGLARGQEAGIWRLQRCIRRSVYAPIGLLALWRVRSCRLHSPVEPVDSKSRDDRRYVMKLSPVPAVPAAKAKKKRKKTPAERNADALYAEHLLYQSHLRDHPGLPALPATGAYGEDQVRCAAGSCPVHTHTEAAFCVAGVSLPGDGAPGADAGRCGERARGDPFVHGRQTRPGDCTWPWFLHGVR